MALDQIDKVLDFSDYTGADLPWNPQPQLIAYLQEYDRKNAVPRGTIPIQDIAPRIDHPTMQRHIDFLRWVRYVGGEVEKTRLIVGGEACHLVATVDLGREESILSVPEKELMRVAAGTAVKDLCGSEKSGWFWETVSLTLDVMRERAKESGRAKPWVDLISGSQCCPLLYSEEEKGLLKGSCTLGTYYMFL